MTKARNTFAARLAGIAGAAALTVGLALPVAAQAGHDDDRIRLSVSYGSGPHGHGYRDHRYRHYRDRDHRSDRRAYTGRYNDRYFVEPFQPLNFKHWWRVERQKQRYTPHLGHLNRYERRQVLQHGYDRYLRDHNRWSKRSVRRDHRGDHRRHDRWLAKHDHDWRNCNDRSHRHDRRRRW